MGISCSKQNFTSFIIDQPGLTINNRTVTLINIQLPSFSGNSTSFSLRYNYNNLLIASASTGIFLTPYCISPC